MISYKSSPKKTQKHAYCTVVSDIGLLACLPALIVNLNDSDQY